MLSFFTPNELIQYRIKTYFSKEPETLEWIDSFNASDYFLDVHGSGVKEYLLSSDFSFILHSYHLSLSSFK